MIDEKTFILAGAAVFTLTRPDGQHFTYRVNKAKPSPRFPGEAWFVNLGISYEDQSYLGMLQRPEGSKELPTFVQTKGSRIGVDAPSVKTFLLFYSDLAMPSDYESRIRMQHAGRCCVCSRELTNPESIDLGIGPECREKVGL